MSQFLAKIFSHGRRDHCTKVPPDIILQKCLHSLDAVDHTELERAIWLWERRPKHVLFDGGKILWGRWLALSAAILALTFFDIPGLVSAIVLSFAGAILLTLDFYWRDRWKRDYRAALMRILRTQR